MKFVILLEIAAFIMAALCSLLLVILLKGLKLLFGKEETKRDITAQLFAEYLQKNWSSQEIGLHPQK